MSAPDLTLANWTTQQLQEELSRREVVTLRSDLEALLERLEKLTEERLVVVSGKEFWDAVSWMEKNSSQASFPEYGLMAAQLGFTEKESPW